MNPPAPDPTGTRIAAGVLTAFFAAYGWFTLWQGGIDLKGRSGHATFVSGLTGIAVAFGAFLIAALGLALLTRSLGAGRRSYVVAVLVLLLPPILYALAHGQS